MYFTALVGEALVAAPIWCFMHIRMDGEDFADNVQRPGYAILFNLFLRPAMMIFGLILSLALFGAGIFIINETFQPLSMILMPEDRGLQIVGALVLPILMLFLHYQVALRSFGLISAVPDRVTRWFNASSEGMNEEGDTRAVVGVINSQSEDRMRMMGGSMKLSGKKGAENALNGKPTSSPQGNKEEKGSNPDPQ